MTEPGRGHLVIDRVAKRYARTAAVADVSLDVRPGEFVTILGPSGSGKTTTLRMVAGFIEPDAGSIRLDGKLLSGTPPYKRDVGLVFQNYALFPHMSAADNIAFPLKMRGVKRAERDERVRRALELVHLGDFGLRRPAQLSGGQQQRIALARAIVFNPTVLLMDEPLGALDKKLRDALQTEIAQVSSTLGITVLYVTHDQEEALALSDRIAIYRDGAIEQLGSGEDLYERPTTLFVAGFMGESNVFTGRASTGGSMIEVSMGGGMLRVRSDAVTSPVAHGSAAALVVRPERISISHRSDRGNEAQGGSNRLEGVLRDVVYLGSTRKVTAELRDGTLVHARLQPGDGEFTPGSEIEVSWSCDCGVLMPDSGHRPAAPGSLEGEQGPPRPSVVLA